MREIHWVISLYPIYFTAIAVWFYVTLAVGIALVGRRHAKVAFIR
jgi:hypothetical protein